MKKVLIIFGTRPEAIKMAPLVHTFEAQNRFRVLTCNTGQHKELMWSVLRNLELSPDFNLDIMRQNQTLFDSTSDILKQLKPVLQSVKPDLVCVQGDTTTAFAGALAAFYEKIPVAHIEAGLRTNEKYSPFPEEMNRKVIASLADFHFAPTTRAAMNLVEEGVNKEHIFITGNTSIDTLKWMRDRVKLPTKFMRRIGNRKIILVTTHRRENFGAPLDRILSAIKQFAEENDKFHFLLPVHPNPHVHQRVHDVLGGKPRILLCDPLEYTHLVAALSQCHLVLTDSGGLQEEAPTFRKPVLVLRESTERPEAVERGLARLVGSDSEKILKSLRELENPDGDSYQNMVGENPFGDGNASERIHLILAGSRAFMASTGTFSKRHPVHGFPPNLR